MDDLAFKYGSLLLTGLAGSLHCVGMCGPILLAFSQAGRAADGDGAAEGTHRSGSLAGPFVPYHAGRIWTYSLLGLVAGLVGQGLGAGAQGLGWSQAGGVVAGGLVVAFALAMIGVIPGVNADRLLHQCAFKLAGPRSVFRALAIAPGWIAKLLLGALMGLIPCGLVYAALALAAGMPTPLHSALGMTVFGLGTLPALSAVLIAAKLVPAKWRVHGGRLAAVFVLAAGVWMIVRACQPGACCPHCEAEASAAHAP